MYRNNILLFAVFLIVTLLSCVALIVAQEVMGVLITNNRFLFAVSVFSLLLASIISVLIVWYVYIPNRLRVSYSCVRSVQVCVFMSFSPIILFGLEKFRLLGPVSLELSFEHSGAASVFSLLISLYYLRRFKSDYVKIHREYFPTGNS